MDTPDVHPLLLHCWKSPNLETKLTYYLSCYIAELFPILKHCWRIPPLITLLKSSKPWIITDFYTCLVTLLSRSHSRIILDVYLVSFFRWVVSNLIKLLSHILSFYIAQLFTILKNSWRYPVVIHCWKALNLEVLLTYTLSYYIAELFLITKHCRCVPSHNILLKSSQSLNLDDVQLVFLLCWAVPNLKTMLTYTLSYYMLELFLILKHCRCVLCHNTLLKSS